MMITEVSAPAWLHRFIIGKKGVNVRKITQDLPKVCSLQSGLFSKLPDLRSVGDIALNPSLPESKCE